MRSIPDPGFAGDDGGADPVVAAALAAYDRAGRGRRAAAHLEALAVLQDARVLVPVVAILDEVEYERPRWRSRVGAPAGEEQRHGRRTDDRPGRTHRAARVHQHGEPGPLGAVLRGGRSQTRPGAGPPGGQRGAAGPGGRPARRRGRPGALRRRGRGPPVRWPPATGCSASTTAAGPGCRTLDSRSASSRRIARPAAGVGWMCNQGASLVPLCLTDQLCLPRAWMIRQAEASSHPHRPMSSTRSSGQVNEQGDVRRRPV